MHNEPLPEESVKTQIKIHVETGPDKTNNFIASIVRDSYLFRLKSVVATVNWNFAFNVDLFRRIFCVYFGGIKIRDGFIKMFPVQVIKRHLGNVESFCFHYLALFPQCFFSRRGIISKFIFRRFKETSLFQFVAVGFFLSFPQRKEINCFSLVLPVIFYCLHFSLSVSA